MADVHLSALQDRDHVREGGVGGGGGVATRDSLEGV